MSGAGANLTRVDGADFTAHAESTLQFTLVRMEGDAMDIRAVTTSGSVIDQVILTARSTE